MTVANSVDTREMAEMEYRIVGDSIVPVFNAPNNTSVSKKSDTRIPQLSIDHHHYGMTDGETDVSKATLCTMLCINCNLNLTELETKFREEGTLEYFH